MPVDNVADYAIFLLDVNGNVQSWNSGAQRLKGYAAREIIGTNFAAFYTDDDVQSGEPARALEIARTLGKFAAEGWRVRKDGTRLWASVVIESLLDHSGAHVGFTKITRDVTQRLAERDALREASKQLRNERERFRAANTSRAKAAARLAARTKRNLATRATLREQKRLMTMAEDLAKVGYFRFDRRTEHIEWSDEVYRIHGWPKGRPLALDALMETHHEDDRKRVADCIGRALRDGTSYHFESRIKRPDGTLRNVVANGQAERDENGAVCGLFGVVQDVTERKAAERDKELLTERITLAVKAAEVGIWDWNIAQNKVVWDPTMFKLYGFDDPQSAATYARWAESLHPEDRARAERELAQAAVDGAPFDSEFRVVWPNGEVRSIRAMATVVSDEAGAPHRIIGLNWDVSDVRQLAEALRVSAEHERSTVATLREDNRLMALAEQLTRVGHWRLDVGSDELMWSDEVYRAFDLPKTFRPTLKEVIAAYHPDDRDDVAAAIKRAKATGKPYSRESRIVRPDGSIRHVISNGQPEYTPDGTLNAIVGAFHDVTEAKEAEREREQLITRVNLATHSARVGIWDWNITTGALVWDSTMYALYGLDEAQFTPTYGNWVGSVHAGDRARTERELAHAVASGTLWETEFRIIWPSGEVHDIRTMGRVVSDDAGTTRRMIGTNWDVTAARIVAAQIQHEKERLAEAKRIAEDTSRAKSDFLANMSHEIRTPMNGIIGLTSLLLDGDLSHQQRGYVTLLADAGRSLLAIINDILDLSKVEAGKLDLESIALSTEGLVDGALSIVRGEATAKGIALAGTIASDVPAWAAGDPTRLRQILLNLLTNAIKFTDHGHVDVTVRRVRANSDFVRFEVSDTGIGVAPDQQPLLFKSFSQVDRSIARKYGGSGLGLAISKRLAEAMSGTMGMTSVPGKGSTFWFTARLPATAGPNLSISDPAITSTSRRILLVDDNAVNQIVAKAMLTQDGHHVVLASDGAEAIAMVKASPFDLVFMDMQMPVMDGLEATRRIRALDGSGGKIPIVALTANAMAPEIARCREAGMNDHLAKPIDRDLLRRAVAAWEPAARRSGDVPVPAPALDRCEAHVGSASGDGPAFNLDVLLEVFAGDEAAVCAILKAATNSIETDVQSVMAGVQAHDAGVVIEAAHRLKGTFSDLRATRLIEICSGIERESKRDFPHLAPSLLAELESMVGALNVAIEANERRIAATVLS